MRARSWRRAWRSRRRTPTKRSTVRSTSGDSLFPNQGNGGYDVIHYDVDIAWTPAVPLSQSTIDATTTIEATTTLAPLESFGLDLEGLTVTSVTVNGDPAVFERLEDDPNGTEPPPKRKLVVTPADPVTGPFTVVVDYEGIPTTHFDNDGSDRRLDQDPGRRDCSSASPPAR